MKKIDLLIAGVGGQGTILAGRIISTVALNLDLDVKMAETHGMAQRGGSVVTHVRLGEKVYAPLVPRGDADFILAFEQLEGLRWLPYLSPEGIALVNRQVLEPLPVLTGQTVYPEGVSEEIEKKASKAVLVDALQYPPVDRNPRTLNVFLMGMLARHTPYPRDIWEEALHQILPPKIRGINQEAFETGYKLYSAPEG